MRWISALLCTLLPLWATAAAAEPDVLGTLRAGHPRLLLTDADLAADLAAARTDPLRAALHAQIIAAAELQLQEAPVVHKLIGPRLLDQSRSAIARVLTGAMAFRLTGDARFAARAKKEMLTAAAFADWNPSHFLDVAELSCALGLGYDWLYAELTPDERQVIRTALVEKGLSFAPAAYHPGKSPDKRLWFPTAHHNWNQVCNGGLLIAALALADEEPALARTVIAGARESLPRAMDAYEPDGAFPEGPGYWGYGTSYNVIALAALQSALGTDFGLGQAPALDRTALYRLYVQSPAGPAFNYADGGANVEDAPEYAWLATKFPQPAALAHSRALLTEELKRKPRVNGSNRFFALHAVWFPAVVPVGASAPALDVQFHGPAQLAIFRSAWDDPRALFLGFKAGSNTVNHAHLDLGSFVLDADGVRWAEDLGPDDYNLPDYFGSKRWTYYRLNNRGHNTLTPGNALQDPKATAPIIAFASTPARAFAVADLTPAYPAAAQKILRGVALLDRARVLVQDDLTGLRPGTALAWRLLTQATVTVVDPQHATLVQKGRTLQAEILGPTEAHFSAKPATPPTSAEKQNEGTTVLAIEFSPATADTRLAVLLTPVGDHWPKSGPEPALTPLVSWK